MEKTYYLYCGLSMEDIIIFITMLMQSCISYEYEYEAGTITLKYTRESTISDVDQFIIDNELDIHDTEEDF